MKNINTIVFTICILVLTFGSSKINGQNFSPVKHKWHPNDNYYSTLVQSKDNIQLSAVQNILKPHGIRVAVKLENSFVLKSDRPIEIDLLKKYNLEIIEPDDRLEEASRNQWINELFKDKSNEDIEISDLNDLAAEGQSCLLEEEEPQYKLLRNGGNKILMCYKNPWELCDTDQWPTVLKEIDIVKIYIGDINPRVNQEQARCFIKALLDNDIKIAIEHGGLLDWHADKRDKAAETSFSQDSITLQLLIDMIKDIDPARNIDILDMDGPLRRMLFPNDKKENFHTLSSAMDELYKVIRLWKDFIPDVKINLLTNFPNWSWDNTPAYFAIDGESGGYGQYREVMNQLRSRNRDLYYRIDGITIDNPYNYALGIAGTNQPDIIKDVDWMKRILELEANAKLLRLDVNMIFNTDGARNDSMYYAQTLAFIQRYREEGGRPNGYWIQSWYYVPTQWLPEDTLYTMTHLVKSALPWIQIVEVDPNKTSEFLEGNSMAALFFVNNTTASQTGVPAWTDEKQSAAIANIVNNLAWWSDMAAHYGKNKTFEIELFDYKNEVVQMEFDPTEGYTSTGANNSRFAVPIMERLGYRMASHILSSRAYAHDLRTTKETDWAFCAYILEGAGSVRAHASLQGPMTVLPRGSSTNGFTFAHEVGHIYGAYDEYWETGATFRNQQSRYGIPNGNFHWRNHPVQPSMMASGFSGGISNYTAGHLKLIDKVNLTTITTEPPNAIYEVVYTLNNGQSLTPQRFQGSTQFHWGEGMLIQLAAFPEISFDNKLYTQPEWSLDNSNRINFIVDKDLPRAIHLTYQPNSEEGKETFTYLHTGNALASPSVSSLAEGGDFTAFTGSRGLSLWDGSQRIIIDDQRNPNAAGIPYDGRVVASNDIGSFAFGNATGPIVWIDGATGNVGTVNVQASYKIMALANNNTIWCAVGADDRSRDGEVAAQGLHKVENNRITILNKSNSNIPSNFVTSVVVENNDNLLVGFNGTMAVDQGLYRYHLPTNQWENLNNQLPNPKVKAIKKSGNDIIVILENGFVRYDNQQWTVLNPQFPANTTIFDVDIDREGHIYYGGNNGLYQYNLRDSLMRIYRTTNSPIHSNVCNALLVTAENDIIVSGLQGVSVISPVKKISSTTPILAKAKAFIYPNPVADVLIIKVDNPNFYTEKQVNIYDNKGQLMHQQIMLSDTYEIDVSSYISGLYWAQIGEQWMKFVVVR